MKAYISLHTGLPRDQADFEVAYGGYARVEFDYEEGCFQGRVLHVSFPEVLEDSADMALYAAVGSAPEGQGHLFMRVPLGAGLRLDPAKMTQEHPEVLDADFWRDKQGVSEDKVEGVIDSWRRFRPLVAIGNAEVRQYPAHLNSIARTARQLVDNGLLAPGEIHPKLFEAINDALAEAGVPILHVTRSASASMHVDMKKLSLSAWGNA